MGVLKFFEGKRGAMKKFCLFKKYSLHAPIPPAVYILNAALTNKKGSITCDKVKFGTAIKIFSL